MNMNRLKQPFHLKSCSLFPIHTPVKLELYVIVEQIFTQTKLLSFPKLWIILITFFFFLKKEQLIL